MSDNNTSDSYVCAHCGQKSKGQPIEQIDIDGKMLDMCCIGCACAAQLLSGCHPYVTKELLS